MKIDFRVVDDAPTLQRVVDLEMSVWGLHPRDAVPDHLLHAVVQNGGVLLVAEAGSALLGLSLAFPARRGRDWLLWSHMTGVHPDYQGQGIGFELKQLQRRWALEHDYTRIGWTFDPLQRGNASFNIHRLKATANTYHVNYYGEMADSINTGLPSDRLEVIWKLKGRTSATKTAEPDLSAACLLVSADSKGQPRLNTLPDDPVMLVEIPANLSALKSAAMPLALEWRLAVREALQQAFSQGYTIVDFQMLAGRWVYVLAAAEVWFLYVVECSDGSLYTGIALDVARRIQQHNRGKGAAYTAQRRPVTLLARWRYPDRSSALKAEAAFKKQRREGKLALIRAQKPFRSGPFIPHEV